MCATVQGGRDFCEEEFLNPVIRSPRKCRSIIIRPEDLKFKIFMCHKDKRELRGTNALEYIKWGESQGYHSDQHVKAERNGWDVGQRPKAQINVNYLVYEVMRFFVKEEGFYVSDNFQEIHVTPAALWQLAVSENSSVVRLFANLTARANFGGGLIKIQTYEVAGLMLVDPNLPDADVCKVLLQSAERLKLDGSDHRALERGGI